VEAGISHVQGTPLLVQAGFQVKPGMTEFMYFWPGQEESKSE
jgi:hypothetical protein